jgi:hypothetical protein
MLESARVEESNSKHAPPAVVPRVAGQKTADLLVDGVLTEVKEVIGESPTTIKNAVERAA